MIRRYVAASFAMVLTVGLAAPASAQVKLAYKYSEDTNANSTDTIKLHQILTIAGMDIESKVDSIVVTSDSVGKKYADGTLPVTQKIEAIKSVIELPGGIEFRYDSAEPDAKIDNPQLTFLGDVFKLLAGSSHTVVLDDKGKVKFVEGTEKALGKLEGLDPKASGLIKKQLQSESIQRAFEQSHNNLSETDVKEGDMWERTEVSEVGGGQTLSFKKRYVYLGIVDEGGRTFDKIDVKSLEVTYTMDPDAESPLQYEKSDLKIDSSEGTILFDRALGRAVKSSEKTRIKGDITFKAGGMELPSKLDLTLDSSSATEAAAK